MQLLKVEFLNVVLQNSLNSTSSLQKVLTTFKDIERISSEKFNLEIKRHQKNISNDTSKSDVGSKSDEGSWNYSKRG